MLAALATAMLLAGQAATQEAQPQQGPARQVLALPGPEKGDERLMIQVLIDKLDKPKISPKHNWVFEYMATGFGRRTGGSENFRLRFRVFSQFRRSEGDVAPWAVRFLLRCWDMNLQRLRLDHSPAAFLGLVDVYLCFGGKAGGEQLFDEDTDQDQTHRVNTIYIYDVRSFTDPLEMARELAHEYGHATMPPIGPFRMAHEEWANGDLGERLYLKWMLDDLKSKRLSSLDVMGASQTGIQKYVAKHVTPLAAKVAKFGPDKAALGGTGDAAMNAYLGLALHADAILPPLAFGRSLLLIGSQNPTDYIKAVVQAVEEIPKWTPRGAVDPAQPVWIPLGNGKLTGGTVLARKNGWAQVKLTSKSFITHPQD